MVDLLSFSFFSSFNAMRPASERSPISYSIYMYIWIKKKNVKPFLNLIMNLDIFASIYSSMYFLIFAKQVSYCCFFHCHSNRFCILESLMSLAIYHLLIRHSTHCTRESYGSVYRYLFASINNNNNRKKN